MRTYFAFYKKGPTFRSDPDLRISNLWESHTPVRAVQAEGMEDAFRRMQGEVWSPNGEARELIRGLGLNHTSMSVGDVLVDMVEGVYYEVDMVGFRVLMV